MRVAPEFATGLERLDGFSHVLIVCSMDQVPAERRRAVGAPAPGSAGPAPSRCAPQNRPNPVGVSIVQLLGITGNVLTVRGLDAVDGTPMLDIKPCCARHDVAADPVLSDWAQRLW